ncbi:7-keto-8-aminopelargonate synthetase-like enzyme/predicted N-acyltransferase [Catalinimonas alkaloidigena]|uniref:aminotransferase class I/II-fold pyridoxal phosphate-dependent enzyme n=1 Tax=Catalinimonas alkaloidigena TaxID=1075417 RepID=UPI0024049691|nr:aminotransferase class I/II-fold pyridoxal phosphate-dependent enzyme [Catalinimonas alkaloidigena]MDF9797391.1 7-keto-8-aminopelargonate synthetase-like enzyme/predicted N-acyltransferase [Catalinimonas alkaloidigena]
MAKSKHNNILDTIGDLILNAKKEGLAHLYTEGEYFDGRHIHINGKQLYHFGTTGYLGLEQDMRLKEAACDAIMRYGTQFPLSKTYVSFVIYKELEGALKQIYRKPIVITKNSTLAHIGIIPSIVRDEDTLVLDQQVHASVQNAAQLLKPRGIPVQLIKHNNMNMLEDILKKARGKFNNVWYAADGVYSMYGDTVPIQELQYLQELYPQLHLYIDDVHGMSWAGKHGAGYVMSQVGDLSEKMVLVGTLSKTFGASGSVVAFGDEKLYETCKIFGGPQTFSAQLEPSSVAAALASAKIHLSEEIYQLQDELREKVDYCNSLINQTNLPLIQENKCPVHFIGTGLPELAYNFAKRLMNEGFYINVATFPVVPVRNTGIRFTISRHNQKEEIKALVDAMVYHYPKSLSDVGTSLNNIRATFKLPLVDENEGIQHQAQKLSIQLERSINKVDQPSWDRCFDDKGIFDYAGLKALEKAFQSNEREDQNWEFIYLMVRDEVGEIVLATFFTVGLWKDDALSKSSVSEELELIRDNNPYYMMSKVLSMGSLITDGEHLFLDRQHRSYQEALKVLCNQIEKLKLQYETKMVMIRDIQTEDEELKEFFYKQGYLKIDLPEGSELTALDFNDPEDYISRLSPKSRSHVRKDILKNSDKIRIEIKDSLTEEEIRIAYNLYWQVHKANHAFNNIAYPQKLFSVLNEDVNWESICYYHKAENKLIGVAFNHKGKDSYQGVILGLDYTYSELKVYKQALFQAIMRAKALGKSKVQLGLTANTEKKKLGAALISRIGFLQADSNYKLELLESLEGNNILTVE